MSTGAFSAIIKTSDIDWSKDIHEIDLQLYKKYNLTDDEWRVLLKALREYAHSLQILIQKAKRHQETYEDIFGSKPQEVKTDWHPSMTQAEMFNELADKMRSSK